MTKILIAVLFVWGCIAARAQTAVAYPIPGQAWHQPLGYVPGTNTVVTTADSMLGQLHLANKSGSTVSVTLTDTSTNCGGSACSLWPAITIAANTVYENNFGGLYVVGGLQWSATAASAVVGWVRGTYVQSTLAFSPFDLPSLQKYLTAMMSFEPEQRLSAFPR